MDLDTIKTAIIGSGGISIQFMDFLPEMVKVGVGITTIIYFSYKIMLIKKQLKE